MIKLKTVSVLFAGLSGSAPPLYICIVSLLTITMIEYSPSFWLWGHIHWSTWPHHTCQPLNPVLLISNHRLLRRVFERKPKHYNPELDKLLRLNSPSPLPLFLFGLTALLECLDSDVGVFMDGCDDVKLCILVCWHEEQVETTSFLHILWVTTSSSHCRTLCLLFSEVGTSVTKCLKRSSEFFFHFSCDEYENIIYLPLWYIAVLCFMLPYYH